MYFFACEIKSPWLFDIWIIAVRLKAFTSYSITIKAINKNFNSLPNQTLGNEQDSLDITIAKLTVTWFVIVINLLTHTMYNAHLSNTKILF